MFIWTATISPFQLLPRPTKPFMAQNNTWDYRRIYIKIRGVARGGGGSGVAPRILKKNMFCSFVAFVAHILTNKEDHRPQERTCNFLCNNKKCGTNLNKLFIVWPFCTIGLSQTAYTFQGYPFNFKGMGLFSHKR